MGISFVGDKFSPMKSVTVNENTHNGEARLSAWVFTFTVDGVCAVVKIYNTQSALLLETFSATRFKVLLDFFQKIAVSKGRTFGRASQSAKPLVRWWSGCAPLPV
jgi:hypothetical protein